MKEYMLHPGFIFYSNEPTMILTVLGASVAVTVYDRRRMVGGMNHFVYPQVKPRVQPTALYAQPAMVQLMRMMHKAGSNERDIEAHVIGGATPDNATAWQSDIGRNNVEAALSLLKAQNIAIAGTDVGGRQGRKVMFNSSTGELVIAKVNRIRNDDWYPDTRGNAQF